MESCDGCESDSLSSGGDGGGGVCVCVCVCEERCGRAGRGMVATVMMVIVVEIGVATEVLVVMMVVVVVVVLAVVVVWAGVLGKVRRGWRGGVSVTRFFSQQNNSRHVINWSY